MQQNEFDELKEIIYRAATNEPFDDRFDNVSENGKFLIRQLEKARYMDKYMLTDLSNVSRHAIELNNVWFDIKMPVSIKINTPYGWQMIKDGDMNCIADTFIKSRDNDKKVEFIISNDTNNIV